MNVICTEGTVLKKISEKIKIYFYLCVCVYTHTVQNNSYPVHVYTLTAQETWLPQNVPKPSPKWKKGPQKTWYYFRDFLGTFFSNNLTDFTKNIFGDDFSFWGLFGEEICFKFFNQKPKYYRLLGPNLLSKMCTSSLNTLEKNKTLKINLTCPKKK